MDIKKFEEEICKTGFVLENRIASELKHKSWTVISNKYYEDDFEGSVREIDLLAYKVSRLENFDVYTTLLISCKKSEENVWALLARDINLEDPNSDWWPLHSWSNQKSLDYELKQPGQSRAYHNDLKKLGVSEVLSTPDVEVFAFQEMSKKNGKPNNDKNIFNAITSLMKAQAYELSALTQRRKNPAIYQFNLISIIDSELIRIKFSDDLIKAEPINSEHYIARYIIKKKESFFRIRFLRASYFKDALADYNQLHIANCRWFEDAHSTFYEQVIKDLKRRQVLIDDFRMKLKRLLSIRVLNKFSNDYKIDDIDLEWSDEANKLSIIVSADPEVIEFLNGDNRSKAYATKILNLIYQYSGEFSFGNDVPF